jgi:membrane-associated phospholipid phosphatase
MNLETRATTDSRCLTYAMAFALLLLAATLLALYPDWLARPLANAINGFTRDWRYADALAFALAYPTLQGVMLVSLIWCCWFSCATADLKARLLSGVLAATIAGLVAHVLKRTLPMPPKPIFDPALQLHLPSVLGDIETLRRTSFPDSHSFPSERAALFAGLAIAILLVRPRLGWVAFGCTLAAEFARVYLGLHYPTDIAGSFCLAAAIVWLAQMRWGAALGFSLVRWEKTSPAIFYAAAFIVCYQLANAFQDLRELLR